jgi:hypothetical protein
MISSVRLMTRDAHHYRFCPFVPKNAGPERTTLLTCAERELRR